MNLEKFIESAVWYDCKTKRRYLNSISFFLSKTSCLSSLCHLHLFHFFSNMLRAQSKLLQQFTSRPGMSKLIHHADSADNSRSVFCSHTTYCLSKPSEDIMLFNRYNLPAYSGSINHRLFIQWFDRRYIYNPH